MKTQNEIKTLLAEKMDIPKVEADKFIKTYTAVIADELIKDGKFKIPSIGTVKIRYRSARSGVNPSTKEAMEIPESLTVGLAASDSLKSKVNSLANIEDYRK